MPDICTETEFERGNQDKALDLPPRLLWWYNLGKGGKPITDNNEVWARCKECRAEILPSDGVCPNCGPTKKAYERRASVKVRVQVSEIRAIHKRKGYKDFMRKMISRCKRSTDPRLKGHIGEGVTEEMVFDKEKNLKVHIIRDAKTGEMLHSEHEPLTKHHTKEVE